jgi:hypothetical protein
MWPNTTLEPTGVAVSVEGLALFGACGHDGRGSAWGR